MNKVADSYEYYLERIKLYKSFGYDIEEEREFIFNKAKPINGRILEVGTGKGYFTIQLAKKGCRLTSIDISEEEQNYAMSNIKYLDIENSVDFKIENAENLSFKDGAFDTIFSINTLHHLSCLEKIVDEMTRVLSENGKIVLSDFTEEGFKLIERIHKSEGREHVFPKDKLGVAVAYLTIKGFEVGIHKSDYQKIAIAYH